METYKCSPKGDLHDCPLIGCSASYFGIAGGSCTVSYPLPGPDLTQISKDTVYASYGAGAGLSSPIPAAGAFTGEGDKRALISRRAPAAKTPLQDAAQPKLVLLQKLCRRLVRFGLFI